MPENTELREMERKIFRDSMQDGLTEIIMGLILLGMVAASVSLVFIPVYILPLILMGPLSELIRRRYTYPRIGYVKLRMDPARKVLPGILLYIIVVFVMAGFALLLAFGDVTNPQLWSRAMPLIFGMMLVGAFLHTADKSGCRRPYVWALLSVLSAVAFFLSDFGDLKFPVLFGELGTGLVLHFLVMGSILLVSGLVVFVLFLRRHPALAEEVGSPISGVGRRAFR